MDRQAMMEAYATLAEPGSQHRLLECMAGSWDASVKIWVEPGRSPVENFGTAVKKMIMGGRFLQEEFSITMIGNPFKGLSITGYDNHKKMFESIWLDSTGTSMLIFEGTLSQDEKKITMECYHTDAVQGPMNWRSVTTILDINKHLFEMYSKYQNSNEYKSIEIAYTRRK